MRYTVCKAPKMRHYQLHNWYSPPAWTALLLCEEWYLQEIILPQPGIYALDESGEDIVADFALKQLGIHPEDDSSPI